jgi:hypothetical protein
MRRSIHVLFVVCCLAVLSSTVTVAQNTKLLFNSVPITNSATLNAPDIPGVADWFITNPLPTWDQAAPFASTQVLLSCTATTGTTWDTASLMGPPIDTAHPAPTLIVDNYIQVQTNTESGPAIPDQNLCRIGDSASEPRCFAGSDVYPSGVPWNPADVAIHYTGVANQSFNVTPGVALYTIRLMDWGFTYASSSVTLNTSCGIVDKVCHYSAGPGGGKWKTLMSDPSGIFNGHLKQHSNDHAGACTGNEVVPTT